MQSSDILRLLVVGGAVVAAVGSATSTQQQPTGYYPRPQEQQQQPAAWQQPAPPPDEAPAATTAAAPTPCDAFCSNVVRCDLGPASDCIQQCRDSKLEQQPNGPEMLRDMAQASCERLAELAQPPQEPEQPAQAPPAPPQAPSKPAKTDKPSEPDKDKTASNDKSSIPAKRTQWVCNATGWWQKCETQGYQCYAQSTMMLGFGSTESTARVSAETECNTAMMRLMSANFAYRTSITSRCKAISCSPPNAK